MPAGPAYRIETPRLILRCWELGDGPAIQAAVNASLDHLRPWMPWAWQEPKSPDERLDFLRRCRGQFDLGQDFVYGILAPDNATVLGGSGLHTRLGPRAREIGYWIRASHAGQGLATEAAAALTRVGFEVDGVDRIEIHCDPANTRSAAVARKLGFTLEAVLRGRGLTVDGAPRDTMLWSLFAADYPATPAARAAVRAYDAAGRPVLTAA